MTDDLSRSIADAARAEDALARVAALRAMNSAQLAAVLGGDPAEAERWVRAAAIHGVAEAQVRLGRTLLERGDHAGALRWFGHAARLGDADAMNMVGRCHENGWGAPKGEAEAAAWYRRSAEAGHDWGEYNYAHMLFDGRGLPQDPAGAYHWYSRAAERGHARAMNLVGRCLEAGWGVAADRVAAEAWYERSARAGYFRAQYNHALALIARGQGDEARVWLELAHAGGDAAMRELIDERFGKPRSANSL